MNHNAPATPVAARLWFRDFGYYTLRWAIIVGVLTALTPVYDSPADAPSSVFWLIKLQQLLLGLGWGFLASIVFTLIQNGVNTARRRPVSWLIAIGVWFGIGFLGVLAAREESLQKGLQKARTEIAKDFGEMKAKAAREQPDRPAAYIVQEEARKKSNDALAKQTNPAKKADVAAGQFIGFYFVNTKTRADYCKRLGVDISAFVQAFASEHTALYQKSRQIHNRDPHGADMIETEVYKAIEPQMQQLIADAMKTLAHENHISEQQVCQIFAEHANEMASDITLAKVNPQLYQAMTEAK